MTEGQVGWVRLHLQGSALVSMITPTVLINGHPVPASYGENLLPVWPGPNTVAARSQWLWEYGKAAVTVDVAPGQVVDLWYAAPLSTFTSGSMGPTKQRHKGLGLLLGLGVAIALAIVVVILFAVVSS